VVRDVSAGEAASAGSRVEVPSDPRGRLCSRERDVLLAGGLTEPGPSEPRPRISVWLSFS
jgi:hypothetical protein